MFNEAFWFFYLIGMVGDLNQLLLIVCISLGIVGAFALMFGAMESEIGCRKFGGKALIAALCVASCVVIVPSTQSLYAGGAQYAVEAVELDDTLLAFKDIIDAKIADLAPDTAE